MHQESVSRDPNLTSFPDKDQACIDVCMHACMYVGMYVYVYVYMHVYVYVYTYMHICSFLRRSTPLIRLPRGLGQNPGHLIPIPELAPHDWLKVFPRLHSE